MLDCPDLVRTEEGASEEVREVDSAVASEADREEGTVVGMQEVKGAASIKICMRITLVLINNRVV